MAIWYVVVYSDISCLLSVMSLIGKMARPATMELLLVLYVDKLNIFNFSSWFYFFIPCYWAVSSVSKSKYFRNIQVLVLFGNYIIQVKKHLKLAHTSEERAGVLLTLSMHKSLGRSLTQASILVTLCSLGTTRQLNCNTSLYSKEEGIVT